VDFIPNRLILASGSEGNEIPECIMGTLYRNVLKSYVV